MPTVFTHALVGYTGARLAGGTRRLPRRVLAAAALLPVVPDLDAFLYPWARYGHPLAHRGFTHSIVFALVLGVLGALACRRAAPAAPGGVKGLALLLAAVTASHGILDALTNGGLGIAFFWPFDARRYFFPVRPIPVSPIWPSAFFSEWGVLVLRTEILLIWPLAGAAVAWARYRARRVEEPDRPWFPWPAVLAVGLVAVGAAAWAVQLGGPGVTAFLNRLAP